MNFRAWVRKLDWGHRTQETKRQFIYLLVLQAKQLISSELISTCRNEGEITIFVKKKNSTARWKMFLQVQL